MWNLSPSFLSFLSPAFPVMTQLEIKVSSSSPSRGPSPHPTPSNPQCRAWGLLHVRGNLLGWLNHWSGCFSHLHLFQVTLVPPDALDDLLMPIGSPLPHLLNLHIRQGILAVLSLKLSPAVLDPPGLQHLLPRPVRVQDHKA